MTHWIINLKHMSAKDWAVIGGICAIGAALTDCARKQKIEDWHVLFGIVGGLAAILGSSY